MKEIPFPEITSEMKSYLYKNQDKYITLINGEKGKRYLMADKNGALIVLQLSKWDKAKMWAKRILGLKTL